MPKPVSDQVIVITGASSGIGLATAQAAARNVTDLDRAVEEIRREGGEALAVPSDVTDYAQMEALAARAVEEYGRIDTWVNNAAASRRSAYQSVAALSSRSSLAAAAALGLGALFARGREDDSLAILFTIGAAALTGKALFGAAGTA